ncbi:Hypothetical protein PP7435_CHR1-0516 [Komagataella phaffii CBS 7435]|uniref:RRM domain-containing protein n=1 Tax=Komagataella phaffii (strain ATCC 76273 / CBS 7435 / CECT 11047 / NRRL Y-11430 / Wegner 21-1) TaxID=981350 RepID=F2QNS6_KOMPC|nr:Hypothetical protein BQ9382_C1-2680 [Komagataella phaffii CBS 7435]CCA36668.1 Hypothetical protein PP7435_CHR1-0516 [Komagataella phaffii CBS 7435]
MENCLYITGFGNGVTKDELRDFFEGSYGKIARVDILPSRDLESTPYAFVQFQEAADFEAALAKKSHLCDLAVDPEKGLKVEKAKSAPNLKRDRMLASRRRYGSGDGYRSYRGGYRDYYHDRYSDRGYHEYSRDPHPRYRPSDYDEGYHRNSYDHYYGPEPPYDYRDGYYNERRSRPSSRDPRDYDPDYYRGYHPQDRHYYSSRDYSRDYQRDRKYEHPQDHEGKASTAYYRDRYPVRPSRKDEALPSTGPPSADGKSPVANEEQDSSIRNN